jgi:hypothetical protein
MLKIPILAPIVSANRSDHSPLRQVKMVNCNNSIKPPNSIAKMVTIATDLYDISLVFCCLIMPLHQKTTSTKKNPQCTSLSNPGKNNG